MEWKVLPKRVLIFGLISIIVHSIFFYFILGQETNTFATKEFLGKQQILSRAESSNIASFFDTFGNSIAVLSQTDSVKNHDENLNDSLNLFTNQWKKTNVIGGVVFINKDGIVEFDSNILNLPDTGVSLDDRDYFTWAKNNPKLGTYFVGNAVVSRVGASKGQTIIPIAAAVYQNNIFVGVVAASVELRPLTKSYLETMKVSDGTDVYLINNDGQLLYSSSIADLSTTSNIFDSLQKNPFIGSDVINNNLKKILANKSEGSTITALLDSKSHQSEDHFVTYSPVLFNNQSWIVVMASPTQEMQIMPIYLRITALLVLVSITIFAFGIFTVRETKSTSKKDKILDQNKL